jgi:hypothetical protein
MLARCLAIGVMLMSVDAGAQPERDKWLVAHGAKQLDQNAHDYWDVYNDIYRGDGGNCVELRVGPKREAALQCDQGWDVGGPATFLLLKRVIYVVRGGNVVKVLDVPVDLFNLDSGWRACPKALAVRVARDGRSVAVDPTDARCAIADPVADEARRINAAPGVYRWRGDRFQR